MKKKWKKKHKIFYLYKETKKDYGWQNEEAQNFRDRKGWRATEVSHVHMQVRHNEIKTVQGKKAAIK